MIISVLWNEKAIEDYEAILDHIYEDAGEEKETEFMAMFENKIALICEFPDIGKNGLVENTREFLTNGYRIVYQSTEKELRILRIVHYRRQYP